MIVGPSSAAHDRSLSQHVRGLVFDLKHLTQNKAKALPKTTAIPSQATTPTDLNHLRLAPSPAVIWTANQTKVFVGTNYIPNKATLQEVIIFK